MDEPTSSLTQEDSQRLFEIIRGLKDQGVSIIYISHFLEEIQRVADSYTVLRDGRSVGSGTMEGTALEDIIQLMVGQKFTQLFPRVEHAVGEAVLSLDRLKGTRMAAPVTLTLSKGEILGVAGLIGSGRTEMLRTLFGLDEVEGGTVVVSGAELAGRRPWTRIRHGLGLLSEDRQGEGLAPALSVADNMTLSDLSPYRRRGLLSPARQRRAVADLIGKLKIKAKGPGQKVGDLSGGNQQKVALARLLHQKASVLLLDEPTRGIDVVSKSQIYEWIGGLAREGKAVLFVSSYLPELLGICDRIAVFHRGVLVESRPTSEWDAAGLMAAATVGRASPGKTDRTKERGMSRQRRTGLGRALNLFGPFIGLLLVIALFALIPEVQGRFLRAANFKSVATQSVIVALGALGMTLVIIGGGIDLSAASNIALASVITAYAVNAGAAPLVAVLLGVLTGGLVGLVNGGLVTRLRLVPFIVTMGMMGIARGAAKWIAGNQKIDAPMTWVNELMAKSPRPSWLLLAPGVWIVILFAVAMAVLLKYTVFGRHIFAVGSNEATARLCGIRTNRVKILVYAVSGLFCGLSGVMEFSRLTVGDPTVAVGLELDIIAAVVIGGGSLSGGEGSILGTMVGVLIMSFLRNGCTMMGWPNYIQEIIIGAIIIVAVALDRLRHRTE